MSWGSFGQALPSVWRGNMPWAMLASNPQNTTLGSRRNLEVLASHGPAGEAHSWAGMTRMVFR